jgi:RNA polymerase-binding transcription factor DksA
MEPEATVGVEPEATVGVEPEATVGVEPEATMGIEVEDTEASPGTLDAVDADLRAVEAALGRIDAGSYGRCEVCGSDIEPGVLAEAPLSRACAAHATG